MAVTDVLLTLAITCVLALAVEGRHRVGGARGRSRRVGEVPGRDRRRARSSSPGGGRWRALGRGRGARGRGVRAHEPVRADPRRRGLGRHLARATPRPRRLARVRERPGRARSRTSIASGRRSGRCCSSPSPASSRRCFVAPRTDLVLLSFVGAYWLDPDAAAGPFRPLRAPARPRARRLRGELRAVVPSPSSPSSSRSPGSCRDARELNRTDTRLRADAWVAANVPRSDRIAADPSTLPLAGRRVVRLELPGPGRPSDPARDLARLRRDGVRWVVISGAVTDRVRAAARPLPARDRVLRRSRPQSAAGL